MDKIFTVALFLLFTLGFGLTFTFPPTAAGVPKIISAVGMLLSVLVFFSKPKAKAVRVDDDDDEAGLIDGGVKMPFGKCFFAIIIYVIAMLTIGFIASTLLAILYFSFALGSKNKVANISIAFICAFGLYFLFTHLFYVKLPVGYVFTLFS